MLTFGRRVSLVSPPCGSVVVASTWCSPRASKRWHRDEAVLAVLAEASKLTGGELTAFLEKEGLLLAELEQWRLALDEEGRASIATTKRIRRLERELARKEKALAEAAALLVLKKNTRPPAGGRGRRHGRGDRTVILAAIDAAVAAGARLSAASSIAGLSARTVQRWRLQPDGDDLRQAPRRPPGNALTPEETAQVLAVMTSPRYASLSPKQLVPLLADEGLYLASGSTMYRLRRRFGLGCSIRSMPRTHVTRASAVHRATGPNEPRTRSEAGGRFHFRIEERSARATRTRR